MMDFIMWLDWEAIIACGLFLIGYGIVRLVVNVVTVKFLYSKKNIKKAMEAATDDEMINAMIDVSVRVSEELTEKVMNM